MSVWKTGLPDSETTVLMKTDDYEYPIWPGFHDGEVWRNADATEVESNVLGWMHIHEASEILSR